MPDFSERGKWHSESDKEQRVLTVSSLEELDALRNSEVGIVVIEGDSLHLSAPVAADLISKNYSPLLPIIYLSTTPVSTNDKIAFFDAGGDAILDGEDRKLLPKILTAIQRRARLTETEIGGIEPIKGLMLDPLLNQLHIKGRPPVNLPSWLRRVFVLLAGKYPDLTKKQTLEDELGSTENMSRVAISKLRKKIAPYKIIQVRDKGYKFEDPT